MSAVFLKLLNMSITAGWLLLAVFAARLLLKKAPRWIVCLLWALAALRLLLPFSLKSVFSLIPSAETVPADIAVSPAPAIHTGISTFNSAVNPIITETFAPEPAASVNPLQTVLFIASIVWAVGVAAMLLYALISFLRLRKTVAAAVPVGKRILLCDEVRTPFILGVFRPKICLPSSMRGETLDCVIAHETAHLKRRDHWWKPLGFLLLSVYWFNPLCWIAYILLCRDIETACDEKVIRDMDHDRKAAYSQALLDCSMQRKSITACPLAFGEAGVKQRVKGILNYKKPAFWIILIALVVCVAIAVCLLTDPRSEDMTPETAADQPTEADTTKEQPVQAAVVKWFDYIHEEEQNWSERKQITIDAYPGTVFECDHGTVDAVVNHTPTELLHGMPIWSVYFCDLNGDGAPEICAAVSYGSGIVDTRLRVHEMKSGITYELSARGKFDYCLNLQDGELIVEKRRYRGQETIATGRLRLEEDGLHFLLDAPDPHEDSDAEREQYAAQQYATETFVYVYPGSNLIPMHTDNVYYCDLNGDGVPERCANASVGSGFVDERICVYDGQTGVEYELSARGEFDYRISQQIGELLIVQKCNYNEQVVIEFGTLELVGDVLRFVPMNPAQNITELLTRIYTDDELTAITQFKGTLSELGQKYPIECLREVGSGSMLYAVYRSESNVTLLYFDRNGEQQGIPNKYHMAHTTEEFQTLQVGDTLDDVMAFDPDGSYLWLYTGIQPPPVSVHCTTDGCIISIEYDNENVITKIEIRMI